MEKHGSAILEAEGKIRDRLPWVVDKMMELAEGVTMAEEDGEGEPRIYTKQPDYRACAYLLDRIMGKPTERKETGNPGDFSNLDGIPEDAARSVIEASERFTSGSRRASK